MTNWIDLVSDVQLVDIQKTQELSVIFKHSTRCPISQMAKKLFELEWFSSGAMELPTYYLDLLRFRQLSNEIASSFSVEHQSPQVLVIKNGECIAHFSHQHISVASIKQALPV